MATDVTAIIPAYNAQPFIGQALTSLAQQTLPPSHIIIIDDASTDATLSTIYQWQTSYPQQSMTVLSNARRCGVAFSRNRGLALANTTFVLWLDADDELEPHCIQILLIAQQSHPNLLLLAGIAVAINEAGCPISQPLRPDYDISTWSRTAQWAEVLRRNPIPSASGVLVHRPSLLKAGGFYSNVKADDWEAWLRLLSPRDNGDTDPILHIVSQEIPTVKVRRHGSNLSSQLSTMQASEQQVLTDLLKTCGWATLQQAMLARPTPHVRADCLLLAQRLGLWTIATALGEQWNALEHAQPAWCFAQGLTAAHQQQWQDALRLFSKVLMNTNDIFSDKPHLAALNNQAVCWAWLGQWDKAKQQWASLHQYNPQFLDANWNLRLPQHLDGLRLSWRPLRPVLLPYSHPLPSLRHTVLASPCQS
jgi:hypothetical protein